jgi:hypothetical protein
MARKYPPIQEEKYRWDINMAYINTKRSWGRKETMLAEVKKPTVCQVENIRMNIAKHRNPAEKETKIQSITGEK